MQSRGTYQHHVNIYIFILMILRIYLVIFCYGEFDFLVHIYENNIFPPKQFRCCLSLPPFVCLSVCLSIHPSIHPSIFWCLFVCPSICLSSICLSAIYPFVCHVHPSIHPSIRPSVRIPNDPITSCMN